MEVKCINQGNFKNITTGNEYEVYFDNGETWSILTNDLSVRNYSKKYFESVAEPIIEDVDEVGVVEEESPEIIIEYVNSQGIKMTVNGNGATMTYYNVAGNCGIYSYNGLNNLFDSCDFNVELFKKAMLAIIETFTDAKIGCMLIFSTNYEFEEIWDVMDEIMDTQSDAVNNPNSEMDVKLWIKYAYYERPDYDEEEY